MNYNFFDDFYKKGGECKMTSKEYLEGIKKADNKWFNDNKMTFDDLVLDVTNNDCRKMRALEIIAEEIINLNSTLRSTVTTLENIDTTLNRR